MRILGISAFDPASVVLSHRDLMRAAGHDMRLAVVRAYTERQRGADYVLHALHRSPVTPGVWSFSWEPQNPNLEDLREFAKSADVIQFHPGIGMGDGDWASQARAAAPIGAERNDITERFSLRLFPLPLGDFTAARHVYFVHGSRATWHDLDQYRDTAQVWGKRYGTRFATSTIDYAHELNATYLPPLVDVGDLRAPLRQDDDPLVIAHTPTDRIACSTEAFLQAAQNVGAVVRLGEGIPHKEVLALKAECNAGFDHLRGAFSVNTLENAALGLAPVFHVASQYALRMEREAPDFGGIALYRPGDLRGGLASIQQDPAYTRHLQTAARVWYESHFSAAKITERLLKFYEGL